MSNASHRVHPVSSAANAVRQPRSWPVHHIYIREPVKDDSTPCFATITPPPKKLSHCSTRSSARCQQKWSCLKAGVTAAPSEHQGGELSSKLLQSQISFTAFPDKTQRPLNLLTSSKWQAGQEEFSGFSLPWPMNSSPSIGISFSLIAFWTHCW